MDIVKRCSVDIEKVLKDVSCERAFWFNNGVVVRNIYEFLSELKQLNDHYFVYHCNDKHDDFASWIGGILGDIELAENLNGIRDKDKYIHLIEHRIRHLEHKHKLQVLRTITANAVKSWFNRHNISFKVIVVILVLAIVVTSVIQYSSVKNMRIVSEKLRYIEQKDSCFDSYLNQKINMMESKNYTQLELTCPKDYTLIVNDADLENLPSRISQEDITVYTDRIVIAINNASWAVFRNTSSMLPVLNHNTKAVELTPEKISDINIGDLISYTSGKDIIVHRVVGKERDSQGYYLITKGDNNQEIDAEKVRFDKVQGIVVMLIY